MLTEQDIDRVIQMAWEDRTPFDAIKLQFGLSESEVKIIMRTYMKDSSWLMWRKRVSGRKTKHSRTFEHEGERFKCTLQKTISINKISKR